MNCLRLRKFDAGYFSFLAAVALIVWSAGTVHQNTQLVDTVSYLDGVWRIYLGQIQHRDFHNLVGIVPFGVSATLMRLTRPDARVLADATVAFYTLFGVAAWCLLRGRYEPKLVALAGLGLGFVILATRILGDDCDLTTYAMNYNRLGWSFLGLILLAVMQPRLDGRPTQPGEWLTLGALAAMLFYIKINFGSVGLCFLLGICLREGRPGQAFLWGGLGTGLVAGVCRVAWGVTPLGYWTDIRSALAVSTGIGLFERGHDVLWSNFAAGVILSIQVFLAAREIRPQSSGDPAARWVFGLVALSLPLIFAVALANSDHGPIPILAVTGISLTEAVRRLGLNRPSEANRLNQQTLLLLSAWTLGLVAVPDAYSTLRAVAWNWLRGNSVAAGPRLTGVLASLRVPLRPEETGEYVAGRLAERAPDQFGLTSAEVAASVTDALQLLEDHGSGSGKIVSFDLFNPFPLSMADTPARGDWIAWDNHRNFSLEIHPPASELLGEATYVLVPKHPFSPQLTALKWEIYGPAVTQEFTRLAESALWTIYIKKGGPP